MRPGNERLQPGALFTWNWNNYLDYLDHLEDPDDLDVKFQTSLRRPPQYSGSPWFCTTANL